MRKPAHLSIGQALKHARKLRYLSQATLAERMGVPRTYIGKVENATCSPHLDSFLHFCAALDIEAWRVLRAIERGEKKPPQSERAAARMAEAVPEVAA